MGKNRAILRKILQNPSVLAVIFALWVHLLLAVCCLCSTGHRVQADVLKTPTGYLEAPLEAYEPAPVVEKLKLEAVTTPVEIVKTEPEPAEHIFEVPPAPAEPIVAQSKEKPGEKPAAAVSHVIAAPPTPAAPAPASKKIAARRTIFSGVLGRTNAVHSVCYVLDFSGSMVLAFDFVRRELLNSIAGLDPSQRYQIILFAGEKPVVFAPALVRANEENQRKASEFLEKVRLGKVENSLNGARAAVAALEAAFAGTTPDDQAPELLYLLTDGEYDQPQVAAALEKLQGQRRQPAVVNVIGCGNPANEPFLRGLAQRYHGRYRFLSDEQLAQPVSAK